jgi:hypothetical protein
MNFTDQERRTHEPRQDASESNLHACHALMRLKISTTSQTISNQWFSVESRFG